MAPEPAKNPELVIDLSQIATPSPSEVSAEPGPETKLERASLENEQLRVQNDGLKQDTAERKKYARCFFVVSCVWIGIITVILILQGFAAFGFKLSEAAILATIGSTTVNILGILYIVANYLFPKRPGSEKNSN